MFHYTYTEIDMKRLITSLAVAAAFSAAGSAFAAGEIVIKFSHVVQPNTPKGQAAEYFKKLAEERTKGRVKVVIYPNSQLYKDKEELEALQLGAVQMLAPATSKFGPMGLKEFEAFDLPYLFMNEDQVHKVTRGPVGQALLKKLESKGIRGLAFWDNGFRVFSANKPLHTPQDIKGLKIRTNSSKVNAAIVQAVGGMPQNMAFSEVYQALQTGVVDGTDGNVTNLYTQKQYEVQKYMANTRHSYSGYAVVVNKAFWDGLPADIRTTLEGAMKEASEYNDKMAEKDATAAETAIRASGKTQIYEPSPVEKAAWVKAMQPVQNEMASRIGMDTLKTIRTAIAK
jgi:C4-dicarboxylate-binding protein DctP